jgi:predicted permease
LPLPTPSPLEEVSGAESKSIHPYLQIASVCLVRFCLCPAICLSIILRAMSTGWVKLDRLMVFVLFLQSCMPSAQNSVLMVQLSGRQADATRLARMLLYIYSLSCIPISILLTLFLQNFSL